MLLAAIGLKKPCGFASYSNFLVTNSRPPPSTVITWLPLHWRRTPLFMPDPNTLTSSFTIHVNVLMRRMCSSSTSLLLPCPPISWQKHYHIQSMKNLWLYSALSLLVTAITPHYHSEGECWNIHVLVVTHPDVSTRCVHICILTVLDLTDINNPVSLVPSITTCSTYSTHSTFPSPIYTRSM